MPTPVGERVWIWLRPGLCLDDLLGPARQDRRRLLGHRRHRRSRLTVNAAFIRVDIKRRDALTGTITSPLLEVIKSGNPPALRDPVPVPTALDLPQVTASEVTPVKPTPLRRPDTQDARSGARNHHHPAPDDIRTGSSQPAVTGACPATGLPLPRQPGRH